MKINENTCILGRRVILVPYRRHHVLKYHNWMKSEELQRLTASEPLSLEEEYDMQKSWHADEDKCTFIVLDKAVVDQTADEVAAMIGDTNLFFPSNDSHDEAEVEIMIAEEMARGKKSGWEAVLLMLQYGSQTLGVKQFVAKIGTDNVRSIRMFTKIGFTELSRSDIFSEVTMAVQVTPDWTKWLSQEIGEAVIFNDYSKRFAEKKQNEIKELTSDSHQGQSA